MWDCLGGFRCLRQATMFRSLQVIGLDSIVRFDQSFDWSRNLIKHIKDLLLEWIDSVISRWVGYQLVEPTVGSSGVGKQTIT